MTTTTEEIRETDWARFTAAVSAARARGQSVSIQTGDPGAYVATVSQPPAGGEGDET